MVPLSRRKAMTISRQSDTKRTKAEIGEARSASHTNECVSTTLSPSVFHASRSALVTKLWSKRRPLPPGISKLTADQPEGKMASQEGKDLRSDAPRVDRQKGAGSTNTVSNQRVGLLITPTERYASRAPITIVFYCFASSQWALRLHQPSLQ